MRARPLAWTAYGILCAALAAILVRAALLTPPEEVGGKAGAAGKNVPAFPGSPYAAAEPSGRISSRAIRECSGIAAGRANPGVFWIHNDSGDAAHLFAVSPEGDLIAIVEIPGAAAKDWEDIAAGPGPRAKVPYLFIGDIGDNQRRRAESVIYRVPEPALRDIPEDRLIRSDPPDCIRFTYPGGSHDCEALAVHPASGDIYLLIKAPVFLSAYRIRRPNPGDSSQVAEKVASLALPGLVTAADIDPGGHRLAVRTYTGLYEFVVGEGAPFEEIFKAKPLSLKPPRERQGEAVCYAIGGDLLTISEDTRPLIFRLARIKPPAPSKNAAE